MPEFAVKIVQGPEPTLNSILYPVIGGLPLFDGATHESCVLETENFVTLSPVGGSGKAVGCSGGNVGGGVEVLVGVVKASGEGLLSVPPVNRAITTKV